MASTLKTAAGEAVAADYGGVGEAPTYESIAARIAACAPGEGWCVVAHSGAGGLAPAVLEALDGAERLIFVDAILPHPQKTWFETAPPALVERLRSRARGGMLPPWNAWFDDDPVALLLADGGVRARFESELPRLPLAWFEEKAPSLAAWKQLPCAYLQLSDAYRTQAAAARANGWPVRRLDLNHLAMITHPDRVAAAILSLASE